MGRLIQQVDGAYTTTYTWADDQVAKINLQFGSQNVNVASNIAYDASRHVTGWTYGNGLQRSQIYDSDGRITGIAAVVGSTTQQNLGYGWDNVDRIASITNAAYPAVSQNFGYDALDRMITQSGPAALSLSYDANGNRTQQNGLSNEAVSVSPTSNRINQRGGHAYTYDANGNRATDVYGSSVLTYAYDGFNRLNTASRSAAVSYCETNRNCPVYPAGTTTYGVNALGQRMQKSNPQETVFYSYGSGGQLSAERSSVNGSNYYIYLYGQPIALIHNALSPNVDTLYYLHGDHLGRPEIITDGSGQKVWQALNYGFDRSILLEGIPGVDIGLPGQVYDAETGNWNNGFRDYDSSDGRYLQSDLIGLSGGLNTYAYASGNPIGNIDPLGLAVATGSMADCLAKIFGQSAAAVNRVNIRNKTVVTNDFVTTRKNSIRLPPTVSVDEFFSDYGLVLHEYNHVFNQWNTGDLTRVKYLAEVVRSGSWAEGNKYEDASNRFAKDNIEAFKACLREEKERCK